MTPKNINPASSKLLRFSLSGLIIFLVLFVFSKSFYNHVEYGVYPSYTESIVEDGDYNIVDEMFSPLQKKAVTSTYHYPNFHSHGSSILWAPFYFYGLKLANYWDLPKMTYSPEVYGSDSKTLKALINKVDTKKHLTHMAMVACTCLLVTLSFLMIFNFFKNHFKEMGSLPIIITLLLIFFGTPLGYYTIFEPGNGTINALFMNICFVFFYLRIRNEKNIIDWILLGAFHSLAFTIKVDSIFYLFIMGDFIYEHIFKNKKIVYLKYLLAFCCGWIFIFALQYLNIITILGSFSYGYGSIFFINLNVFWDTYFSSYHGVFFNSPILIFPLFFSFLLWKKKNFIVQSPWTFLTIGILVKLVVFGMTYTHGSGVFGGRQLIPELPWVAFIFLWFYSNYLKGNRALTWVSVSILTMMTLWNSALMFVYYGQEEKIFEQIPFNHVPSFYWEKIIEDSSFIDHVRFSIFNIEDFSIKLSNFIIPSILFFIGGFYLISKKINNYKKLMYLMTPLLFMMYFVFTLSSLLNNKKNIAQYKHEGYYRNALVGEGPLYSTFYENVGSVEERILFLSERESDKELKRYLKLRRKMTADIKDEIKFFPSNDHEIKNYFREFDSHEKLNGN